MEGMDLTEFEKRLIAMEVAMEKREAKSIERERKALILSEVSESGNVINVEQVAQLISDQIRLVDGKLIVVNSEGQTRVNKSAECISVKELVAEFLINNPHFEKRGGG